MKAWVSEPVQGQKLVSTRDMQDVGGDGQAPALAQFEKLALQG